LTHLLPRLAFLPMLLFVLGVMAERTPVATAQSMAEQLATARRLEFGGEWEEAERFYQGVVQAGGEHGQAARLDLARLYERWERYTPALETLRPVLEGQAPARAWLQQGSVLQALGRADDANAAYGRYIAANGPAAAYARVESAKMQAARDDAAGALAMLSPLLDGRGPDNARRAPCASPDRRPRRSGTTDQPRP